MGRKSILGLVLSLWATLAIGQTTTVTGNVTDPSSTVWVGARVAVQFVPVTGFSGNYTWNGVQYKIPPAPSPTTTDNSGNFSLSGVPDNLTITPAGSRWQFVITPLASTLAQTTTGVVITGTSQNVTSFISGSIKTPLPIDASPQQMAYNDDQMSTPQGLGWTYFRTSDGVYRQWTAGGWVTVGGGSGTVNPGANYKLSIYPLTSGSTLNPSNISTDAAGNNLNVPGAIGTGTSPTACGTAPGCIAASESSTTGSPLVGESYFRADSTLHRWVEALNGGSEIVSATLTDFGAPPAIGNTTPAPLFYSNAANYPYNSTKGKWYGNWNSCAQDHIPNDPGGVNLGSACMALESDNEYFPGWIYGSPGTGSDVGGFTHQGFSIFPINDYSNGISQGMGLYLNANKAGDIQLRNDQLWAKPAALDGGAESVAYERIVYAEQPEYLGVVATSGGGSGATTINLNLPCTANCATGIGLNAPLLDLSSVQSGTLTWSSGGEWGGTPATVTTSLTVGASLSGTLAADVDVPRTINNTTKQLSSHSETVTLNTTTDLTTLSSPIVCSIMGPAFFETIGNFGGTNISFGTYNSGAHTQTVTAIFHYSHSSGTTFYCGGAVGGYVELTADTVGSNRYVENVFGSTGAHTLIVGHQIPNGVTSFLDATYSGAAMKMYQGGEVYGVVNSNTSLVDGGQLTIGANVAAWADADNVEETNNISASYIGRFFGAGNFGIQNPYATSVVHNYDSWVGLGGGKAQNVAGWNIWDNGGNAAANYIGVGSGKYFAPYVGEIRGTTLAGFFWNAAPPYQSAGVGKPNNCAGYLLCTQGLTSGASSNKVGFLSMGDNGAYLRADDSTHKWEFGGADLTLNGNTVCSAGVSTAGCGLTGSFTANILLKWNGTAAANSTITDTGTQITAASPTLIDESSNIEALKISAGSSASVVTRVTISNPSGSGAGDWYFQNWGSGGTIPGVMDFYFGGNGTDTLALDAATSSVHPQARVNRDGVLGWASSTTPSQNVLDTGCNRESAGVINCGNGTFGDKTAILALGSYTATGAPTTVSAGQINYSGTTAAATNCGTLAGAAGCVEVNVAGTLHYVPYY